MSNEVEETETSLTLIITNASEDTMSESASELRWAAKSLLARMNTDPRWAEVQATLRQMTSESTVDAILDGCGSSGVMQYAAF